MIKVMGATLWIFVFGVIGAAVYLTYLEDE